MDLTGATDLDPGGRGLVVKRQVQHSDAACPHPISAGVLQSVLSGRSYVDSEQEFVNAQSRAPTGVLVGEGASER